MNTCNYFDYATCIPKLPVNQSEMFKLNVVCMLASATLQIKITKIRIEIKSILR